MNDLYVVLGLVGAVLCLAGHLSQHAHSWGPHLLALGGMTLMACGEALLGAYAATAACLWSIGAAYAASRKWDTPIDLASMALLMTLMTHDAVAPSHVHAAGMTGMMAGLAVLIVVIWVTARAGALMIRRLYLRSPGHDTTRWARRARPYHEAGSVMMVLSMAAMLL